MPNRSKTKKLQVIFILDILIVSLAATGYVFLQPTFGEEQTLAAEFQVTNLSINPTEVRAGLPLVVSVNVTNIGTAEGDCFLDLEINGELIETQLCLLAVSETKTVEFTATKSDVGTYNIKVADLLGTFTVVAAPPVDNEPDTPTPGGPANGRPANIVASNLVINPVEVWSEQSVTVSGIFTNHGDMTGYSTVGLRINDQTVETKDLAIAGGQSVTAVFTVTAGGTGDYNIKLGALTGSFKVVPNGMHTLTVGANGAPADFTLDGQIHRATYATLVTVGSHTIGMPITDPTGVYRFLNWEDDRYNTNPTRTVTVQSAIRYDAVYEGGASCPSLYYWNGAEYVYVAEISNGGWLGSIGHITPEGDIVFTGGNPWDHAKMSSDQMQLKTIDGKQYYDVIMSQRWSEIFYLDRAYMVVADHSADTDVYAAMVHYRNPAFTDEIYTVGTNLLTPVSAVNEYGDSVLSYISELDGVFTPGYNGVQSPAWNDLHWNVLTLNLGDLSGAQQVKLVINGMVDWGSADDYYPWIELFDDAFAKGLITEDTEITPAPYLEVKNAVGDWVRVTDSVQMPIPADYVARSFVVDLSKLFPVGTTDYSLRLCNFWNVTFDYIGVDITPQANVNIQKIEPIAELLQVEQSISAAAGNFTRYGDVTELLATADNMFVIGRQGDEVHLLFPV
ncbi:MAG: CARDB domain-containing protein, partial [Candidatus Bathyarchaeia archaeon]